jgi:hypothetical protein
MRKSQEVDSIWIAEHYGAEGLLALLAEYTHCKIGVDGIPDWSLIAIQINRGYAVVIENGGPARRMKARLALNTPSKCDEKLIGLLWFAPTPDDENEETD